jgi:hypothetical protein
MIGFLNIIIFVSIPVVAVFGVITLFRHAKADKVRKSLVGGLVGATIFFISWLILLQILTNVKVLFLVLPVTSLSLWADQVTGRVDFLVDRLPLLIAMDGFLVGFVVTWIFIRLKGLFFKVGEN